MRGASGISLLEALVALTLIGLAAAISFPVASDAVSAARVRTAVDEAQKFLLDAQLFADRHRQAVLVRIDPQPGRLSAYSADGAWTQSLDLDSRLQVAAPAQPREAVLQPGAALPPLHLSLTSAGGQHSGVLVDPLMGDFEQWKGEP